MKLTGKLSFYQTEKDLDEIDRRLIGNVIDLTRLYVYHLVDKTLSSG